MATREELYATILDDPEEVSRRLVYADWLDENDEPERAEFIRVEYELVRCEWCGGSGMINSQVACVCTELPHPRAELRRREKELRRLHPEWLRAECPRCKGVPHPKFHEPSPEGLPPCLCCGGLGDLFRKWHPSSGRGIHQPRTVVFRNGFPHSVGCELREIGAEEDADCPSCFGARRVAESEGDRQVCCPTCHGHGTVRRFVPSAWAKAVAKAFPVTRFVDPSMKPEFNPAAREGASYDWLDGRRITSRSPAATLPGWLFAEVVALGTGYQNSPIDCYVEFPTAEAAIDAAALGAGRVVRRAVCGEGRTGG
jgi:uncharacterized protein (TIGR02996 family)